jgi:hypothetical protein
MLYHIEGELRETLRSIIQYIEILYGIKADLSALLMANKDPAEGWVDMSNKTLSKIESAQGSIKRLVQSQQSESGHSKTDSKN